MRTYREQRRDLIASAEPGTEAARRLSRLTEEVVTRLAAEAPSLGGRWALVALGGWGAGALLPASDLDLLVLHDGRSPSLKPFVEAILYPLWDEGLTVGHQVRTPREHARATREDLQTMTASLTGRPIAGDVEWAQGILDDIATLTPRQRRRVLSELIERERPGSAYLLEPDLKSGHGGRRDFDELVWLAAIVAGAAGAGLGPLVRAGHASREEATMVTTHAETVSAARFALQRAGLGDRMTLEALDALTVDAEQIQLALAETALVLDRVRARVLGRSEEAHDPVTPEALLTMVRSGSSELRPLERAAQSGDLEHLIPGMRALMTCRRPGLGHDLTVGAHCLKAASLIADLPRQGALGRSLDESRDDAAVTVAALLHDIGKVESGEGHAQRGAAPSHDAALRLGLTPAQAQDVADYVRLHLVLPETAFNADLDNEDEVLLCAMRIGRRELLPGLHVLTAVDSMATGPAMWGPWQETLVGALVSRLDAALSDAIGGAGVAALGESIRQLSLELLRSDDPPAIEAFVRHAPLRYLAAREPGEVIQHARLAASVASSAAAIPAAIAVRPGPAADTHTVSVIAPDRPELFARLAGAISLAGLDILAADAYGAPDHLALDVFVVKPATKRAAEHATWQTLERYIHAALLDRLALQTRLAERRRHYPARAGGGITVETDNRSGYATAVRVRAPDRPGLLFDLAMAVSETGLDIRWARVMTVDGVASDTFHIVDADGEPVRDPGVLGHLAMRMRAAQ